MALTGRQQDKEGEAMSQTDDIVERLNTKIEQSRSRVAECEKQVAAFKLMDEGLQGFTESWQQALGTAKDRLAYRTGLMDIVRDRDEWREQHENLLSVRQLDLAVVKDLQNTIIRLTRELATVLSREAETQRRHAAKVDRLEEENFAFAQTILENEAHALSFDAHTKDLQNTIIRLTRELAEAREGVLTSSGFTPKVAEMLDALRAKLAAAEAREKAEERAALDALRLLLNFTRQTRQGYVLVPFADRIVEVTAEHALALVEGPPEYAAILAAQVEELKALSAAEIVKMNASIAQHQPTQREGEE